MKTVRVAACQLRLLELADFHSFTHHIQSLLDQAKRADIVVFPEYANLELLTLERDWQNLAVSTWAEVLRKYEWPLINFLLMEAQVRGQYIIFGYIKPYTNSVGIFSPNGTWQQQDKYNLIHRELKWGAVPGFLSVPPVWDLKGIRVGINLCYESEFPEHATRQTGEGMELLIVPAATFSRQGYWRVAHCTMARAIENQVYAVHCPLVGRLGDMKAYGKTSFCGPCDVGFSVDGHYTTREEPGWDMPEKATLYDYDIDALWDLRKSSSANIYKDRFGDK